MDSKIIQITQAQQKGEVVLTALCEDGSLWQAYSSSIQIPKNPGWRLIHSSPPKDRDRYRSSGAKLPPTL